MGDSGKPLEMPQFLLGGQAVPLPRPARIRTCTRCESVADWARDNGHPVPPVHQARSWLVDGPNGVRTRVWSALCSECEDIDRKARQARRTGQSTPVR